MVSIIALELSNRVFTRTFDKKRARMCFLVVNDGDIINRTFCIVSLLVAVGGVAVFIGPLLVKTTLVTTFIVCEDKVASCQGLDINGQFEILSTDGIDDISIFALIPAFISLHMFC